MAQPAATAFDTLRAYLEPKARFSDEEFAFMRPLFVPKRIPAGGFLQRAGSIVLRVPQKMLASYLGITPETLSRIRHKLSRR